MFTDNSKTDNMNYKHNSIFNDKSKSVRKYNENTIEKKNRGGI